MLFSGQWCVWICSFRRLNRQEKKEGPDWPLFFTLLNRIESRLGAGCQLTIVGLCVGGWCKLFVQAGHSRVDGVPVHFQKFRVSYLGF